MLDIWVPDSLLQGPPRAAVVKIHGGGWVQGNKNDLTAWDKWLSELGYPVFDVEYRMSSPGRWQDETGDVKAALGWVSAHAAEFNVDPNRIITMGNSAGANLALLSAYSYQHPQLPPSFNMPAVKVKCVIDIYGPSDMATQYSTTGSPDYVRPLMKEYIGGSPAEFPDRYHLLSPISHVGPGSPPTIIFQGEYDRIVPKFQSISLDEALGKSGVPHELWLLPLSDHVFDANWTFFSTQIAKQKIQAFLEKYGK